MAKKTKRTRGPGRFASLTYQLIADWSGYTLGTVRNYAQQGRFDRHDLAACLCWINQQRQRRGWQLIGIPGETPEITDVDTIKSETLDITH